MTRISVLLYLSGALNFCPSLLYQHYVYVAQSVTWSQAQLHCRTYYKDLLTVESQKQLDLIKSVCNGAYFFGVWIGLYRNTSTNLYQWSNGARFMYSRWIPGQPGQDRNMCTAMSSLWQNLPCGNTYYFVCFQASNNSYYTVTQGLTWTAARNYCKAEGCDLVSIKSEAEYQKVKSIIGGYTVWIGLYWDSSSGQWQWADGAFSSYQSWNSNEPSLTNSINENELCIHTYGTGCWNDASCTRTTVFMCYQDITVDFYLIKEKKTFLEAVFYCRMYYTDIVSIPYIETQQQVAGIANNASGDGVWIGLRWHQISGHWMWMNKDPVSYTNWNTHSVGNLASSHCGVMRTDKNFTWSDACCSARYEFICYKQKT
ncbi:macrophage mannose receptor 1-like [Protopterus annectens]|uniref:macrophage mannose receptor 1-like n=1 Tax=Protopterus annectens TaxID=7888 RepID=UPI001CFC0D16|nr:macrophage mannose receptor 1-like [Protopterus annectens]